MARRAIENEAPRVSRPVRSSVEVLELSCECGRRGCRELLHVSAPTLEWARARGLIVLHPGHAAPDDAVVERTKRFLLARPERG
jgi:hypothetical protein